MINDIKLIMDDDLPLRDVVFNTLREAILMGTLIPGERLMELHLANRLGVSRTPIREALHMLEKEGLVVTTPRRGSQVAKMSEKDLQDVLEVRIALDDLAVTCAVQRMTDEELQDLENAFSAFVEAAAKDDYSEIATADEDFHNVIYRMVKNPKLESIISNIRHQIYRYRHAYIKNIESYNVLIDEHRRILEGFRQRNEAMVKEAMNIHLENQIEAVRTVIREQ